VPLVMPLTPLPVSHVHPTVPLVLPPIPVPLVPLATSKSLALVKLVETTVPLALPPNVLPVLPVSSKIPPTKLTVWLVVLTVTPVPMPPPVPPTVVPFFTHSWPLITLVPSPSPPLIVNQPNISLITYVPIVVKTVSFVMPPPVPLVPPDTDQTPPTTDVPLVTTLPVWPHVTLLSPPQPLVFLDTD